MTKVQLTIGELSRRTGLPVKTLRFWSDEGLLPPDSRSPGGYRIYGEEELVRLDLVRTLRDAGLGIEAIRKVLRRDMSLADALRLQLAAVDAHVASLQGVAAALRAALRGEASEEDLRRISAITRLSNDERRNLIEQFQERVAGGLGANEELRKKIFVSDSVKLPEHATPAQLDAWIELADLTADPSFIESLRVSATQIRDKNIDAQGLRLATERASTAGAAARARDVQPAAEECSAFVRDYVEAVARACGQTADAAFCRMFRERLGAQDPRVMRHRELLAILSGQPSPTGTAADWRFIGEAVKHHLPL